MRPAGIIAATLAIASGAFAKSVVISFDKNTPDSVLDKVKSDILAAGGKITHTYNIIKGFAVDAPEDALNTVQAWGTEHSMRVEDDQEVSINF